MKPSSYACEHVFSCHLSSVSKDSRAYELQCDMIALPPPYHHGRMNYKRQVLVHGSRHDPVYDLTKVLHASMCSNCSCRIKIWHIDHHVYIMRSLRLLAAFFIAPQSQTFELGLTSTRWARRYPSPSRCRWTTHQSTGIMFIIGSHKPLRSPRGGEPLASPFSRSLAMVLHPFIGDHDCIVTL